MENTDWDKAIDAIMKQSQELVELRFAIAWSIVYQNNLALVKLAKKNEQIAAMVNVIAEERKENEK